MTKLKTYNDPLKNIVGINNIAEAEQGDGLGRDAVDPFLSASCSIKFFTNDNVLCVSKKFHECLSQILGRQCA